MKQMFNVTGMSCSACSAHIEKAVSKIKGVDKVSVNLLKGTMIVEFDESQTSTQQIIATVQKAGYGASTRKSATGLVSGASTTNGSPLNSNKDTHQDKNQKRTTQVPIQTKTAPSDSTEVSPETKKKLFFNVTGMSCSACSAHVEKAVSKMPGVDKASVNLLKGTMMVEFDADKTGSQQIIATVEKAGYGASLRSSLTGVENKVTSNEKQEIASSTSTKLCSETHTGGLSTDNSFKTETHTGNQGVQKFPDNIGNDEMEMEDNISNSELNALKRRLIWSIVLSIPLMYVAMAPMMSLPLPSVLEGNNNIAINAFSQLLLAVPVVAINFKFYRSGFSALLRRVPNMDSLVAIGSAGSMLFGFIAFYIILYGLSHGDNALVAHWGHNLYFDSAAMILTLITLGKYFEARAKHKTSGAISKLLALVPKTATIMAEGKEKIVPISIIVPGDIVILKSGERVPVDGKAIKGEAVIDESSLTGESIPVEKTVGSELSAATLVTQGYLQMQVTRVGDDTTLAQIIQLVDEATSSRAPVSRLADKISMVFVPVVIGIAIITAVVWLLLGKEWTFALTMALSVLVISCPCALGLATPTAIMVASGKGAEHGILFKSAESIERCNEITAVVLDKTGTITTGKPIVTDILPCSSISKDTLLEYAYSVESHSDHPLAKAVINEAKSHESRLLPADKFAQKFGEVSALVDGKSIQIGNISLLKDQDPNIQEKMNLLANEGKTPLAVIVDNELSGIIAVADAIKPDSIAAVKAMQKKGQEVWMATGDNERTANAVAKTVGIKHVVSGILPAQKEVIVQKLQDEGKKVLMVGDGINDAPALTRADVGMAIGAGTDVAIDSADVVLMKSFLGDAVNAESLSAATMLNIKENLFWAFIYNIIGIPVAAGVFYGWFGLTLNPMIAAAAMSMSSFCVVSNALRLRNWKPTLLMEKDAKPSA